MRLYLLTAMLLAPALSFAHEQCAAQADRNLDIDLAGAKSVRVVVNSHEIHLEGTATPKIIVRGKACASDQDGLKGLTITQQREGDVIVVELKDETSHWGWGSHYSDLKVDIKVPTNLPVDVKVGSGDANVRNVVSLQSSVGSGDLDVSHVSGSFSTNVGSGDVDAQDVGPVRVGSIGSGDFTVKTVRGDVSIDSIGSGDANVSSVTGNIKVGTIGSGDLHVNDATGSLTVDTLGSGDVDHHGVAGKVSIPVH
ncbi:hypothetical protein FHW69_000322 [Luteibacter sp. Sphag1AF]|uniref:DUF4097 family beta strand repeat-containing protein n=1 Tax=Luteibacter sp. Sphag1AF TaxID=2587031 RepID=UPI00162028A0|nr:DUF4097 family beta strand repeat-containing protein [Luteibacter sp. Sphag1AF]MBB3225732.1 hypothetical protein [Luteibacter sp. Sphag1AF]